MTFRQITVVLALAPFISPALAFDTNGSLLKFPDNATEFKNGAGSKVCIPAGTVVRVINGTTADSVKVRVESLKKAKPSVDCSLPQIEPYAEYTISTADLAKHDYIRRGISYGTLVVPFKYQTHDHSLQPGVTLGGYLGLQWPFWGLDSDYNFTVTPLVFAGGSWATTPQSQPNGSASNSNQLGISYGAGAFVTLNNVYQLGLIAGWDRLGSNASPPSPYEGKAWVSFAIGWNFAQ
ncbi:MAG TPA: hypothetical protein VFK92_11695 [Burkholderiales bacterium]|nr:hypothetical protein [Burkholderiales bacterium]